MAGPTPVTTRSEPRGWLGHPSGLSTLFFTEMWERFSYYGMRAFLILYMTAPLAAGGLGFDDMHAGSVYGTYTGSIWLATIGGGLVADRLLGAYRSVLVGGPIIAGALAQNVDWHLGFGCAGVGMTLGLVQYVAGRHRLRPEAAGVPAPRAPAASPQASEAQVATGTAGVRGVLGFTPVEWKRIGAVCVFFLFAALFWGAYEQAASTLNLFADRHVDRVAFGFTFPASWFVSIQAMFVIMLAPVFAWIWVRLGRREPSTPVKFAFGLLLAGVSFVLLLPPGMMAGGPGGVLVSPLWLVAAYFLQVAGEMCLSPVGNSVVTKLAPARVVGVMMGVWFLSIAAGNKLSGWSAGLGTSVPLPTLFGAIAAICIAAALILLALSGPIRRLMGGVR